MLQIVDMRAGIFIDDSGNPGTKTENRYDTTDRKSWYALLLTAEERIDAESVMTSLIQENHIVYGTGEFHFTDIFSGIKAYKGISIDKRMQIFAHFAKIFRKMRYPILHQTMTSADYERSRIILPTSKLWVDGFDVSRHDDLALYYLLLRCHFFLKRNRKDSPPVEVIVDSGRQKDGSMQQMNNFQSDFIDKTIRYVSSEKEPLLQLADYVAFCLNKVYWLQNKTVKTDLDIAWLEIFSFADFQILSMLRMPTNFRGDTKGQYEKLLSEAYKVFDGYSNIDLEEMIGQLNWNK